MRPRVVGLLLTLRCTANCRHCCFECSPQRTEHMPVDDAVAFVHQVASAGYLRGISLTGGEPFVEREALEAIFAEVARTSLKVRIVSNCFWATDLARARTTLAPFVQRGLAELSVSYDDVHREFVPAERVAAAVRAALDLGLKVVISTTTLNGDIAAHMARVQGELGLEPHERLYIMPGYIAPNGRARRQFAHRAFCYTAEGAPEGRRLEEPCPHVIREPVITPAGDLAACCSPSTATRTGFADCFVIGNLHGAQLTDLLESLENDLVFNILMIEGPWSLYRTVLENEPAALPGKRFVNICDLCFKLLNSRAVREVLRRCLAKRGDEILAKKLYLQALAGGDVDDYLSLKAGVFCLRPQR